MRFRIRSWILLCVLIALFFSVFKVSWHASYYEARGSVSLVTRDKLPHFGIQYTWPSKGFGGYRPVIDVFGPSFWISFPKSPYVNREIWGFRVYRPTRLKNKP